MQELIAKAEMFATAAHNGAKQKRKVTGEDYIVHPKAVAAKTRYFFERLNVKFPDEYVDIAVAVAWLHDTIEDTGVKPADIEKFFDHEVSKEVLFMTHPMDPNMSRDERNAAYIEQLKQSSFRVQVVKLADVDCNFEDIVESHRNADPKKQFSKFERFINEKRKMIQALAQVRDLDIAVRLLEKFDAFLALKKAQKEA